MQIIGHRGACGYEPENTIASFKRALEIGVDAIELDVHTLPSGELVVIHDEKVDRTTNGSGYVVDYSFTALRALDAGQGQIIPTLDEAIDVIDKQVPLNIELKGLGTASAVAAVITRYLDHGWSAEHFMVSSFNHVELAAFSRLMPNIQTGALIVGIPVDYAAFASNLKACSVNLAADFITQEFVQDAKNRGLKVLVFTADDQSEVERMKRLGVDAIFANYPDLARRYAINN